MVTYSKSRLATYISCPEKYRLHYALKIRPIKTSPSLVEGSAIHHLVETGLIHGSDALLKANTEFWEAHPLEICDYPDLAAYEAAQEKCIEQSRVFLDLIGPMKVKEVEAYISAPLVHPITGKRILGIHLQGYIDILEEQNGQLRIIDLKTTAKSPMAGTSVLSIDLSVYAYLTAYPEFNLKDDIPVALLYLVRIKSPQVIWQTSKRSLDDMVDLLHLVLMIATAIETQQYWRNPGMHCSWCDYKPICFNDETGIEEKFGTEIFQRQEQDPLYC